MTRTNTTDWPSGFRVMITGHRSVYDDPWVYQSLVDVLSSLQHRKPEGLVAISGMAVGADMLFAEAALSLSIPIVAALPCPTQDSRWPPATKERYRRLLAHASKVVQVWEEEGYRSGHIMAQYHARNQWMVDHSAEGLAIGVWDGRQTGGTWHAIQSILKQGRKILVCDITTKKIRIVHPVVDTLTLLG